MTFSTIIEKKDPMTGEVTRWDGPNIEAIDWTLAQRQVGGFFTPGLKVDGLLNDYKYKAATPGQVKKALK